jgi:hypothetical protein
VFEEFFGFPVSIVALNVRKIAVSDMVSAP